MGQKLDQLEQIFSNHHVWKNPSLLREEEDTVGSSTSSGSEEKLKSCPQGVTKSPKFAGVRSF